MSGLVGKTASGNGVGKPERISESFGYRPLFAPNVTHLPKKMRRFCLSPHIDPGHETAPSLGKTVKYAG
jgi:hypothetical protein